MFGLGFPEIVVILLVALIVLGPQKLPEIARHLARFVTEMRGMADEVRRQFDEAGAAPPAASEAQRPPAAPSSPPEPEPEPAKALPKPPHD